MCPVLLHQLFLINIDNQKGLLGPVITFTVPVIRITGSSKNVNVYCFWYLSSNHNNWTQ